MAKNQIARYANHILAQGMNPVELQLSIAFLALCEKEFQLWRREVPTETTGPNEYDWILFLKTRAHQTYQYLENLKQLLIRFQRAINAAVTKQDKQQVILEFAHLLGIPPVEIEKDRQAFSRWFDIDAMLDRFSSRIGEQEQMLTFILGRLGTLCNNFLNRWNLPTEQLSWWSKLQLEPVLKPLLLYEGDPRVNHAALVCLVRALQALQPSLRETGVDDAVLQHIYRVALQVRQNVWIQTAAIELLALLSISSFEQTVRQRIFNPKPGDDIFVRRKIVKLLGKYLQVLQAPSEIIQKALSDPSPFVRQALTEIVAKAAPDIAMPWIEQLALIDESPQVRAAMWLQWPNLITKKTLQPFLLRTFQAGLQNETDDFVLRVMCHVTERCTNLLSSTNDPFLTQWSQMAWQNMVNLRCSAKSLRVRRWASQTLEFIWTELNPRAKELRQNLQQLIESIPPGKSKRIPKHWTADLDPSFVGRVLATVCRYDHPVQLKLTSKGFVITRGYIFGFRWWRWWHELKHPSPDKRQAFPHTIGRIFHSEIHIHTTIMAEMAQTKVPGEPLYIPEEGGWRPYLPLLDEFVSAIELGFRQHKFYVFTPEGITEVESPRGWQRIRALLKLTFKFEKIAQKRNWREHFTEDPKSYLSTLLQLGFKIRFHTYPDLSGVPLQPDLMVLRFFPVFFAVPWLDQLWQPIADYFTLLFKSFDKLYEYFVSLYQNSVFELTIFIIAFCLLFFGIHLFANLRLRYWRSRIPLVIGGWGTRGKSGTERLKAALFNSLGYATVSKTTGCEAMLLHSWPFGELKEMFLFRPYDKATIWEQTFVVRLAGRLHAQVLLWECMGLNPSYVRVLQRHWMKDDFATITNTYPDHEDIQGPAGFNVAEVIAGFIPEKSTLVTTEEQMIPILKDEARRCKTKIRTVGWLEAGLLTPDVLQRFPYEEHPYNIALVLGLAEELGIDRDFALKEMADRVVPDLGVLKTFPAAPIRTRKLEFTNGMSANERFGTLNNWSRIGFDKQDYINDPGVWISTVVNNRADRVARSQVFARILVNDISADRHFLIGGNLSGLLGYIDDAWKEAFPRISLWKDVTQPNPEEALFNLERHAIRMRLPVFESLIKTHLKIMLSAQSCINNPDSFIPLWNNPDELQKHLQPYNLGEIESAIINTLKYELSIFHEYHQFRSEISKSSSHNAAQLNNQFRSLLQKWFNSKLVVIWDYHASGDEIVETIARHTPPGFYNRIMGIQNIKGTGLDFVYRWLAWEKCYKAAKLLRENATRITYQTLAPLASFNEFGVLCEEYVRETVLILKNSNPSLSPQINAELDRILEKLEATMSDIRRKISTTNKKKPTPFQWIWRYVEELLDADDAVRRRKHADMVYEDLIAQRINRDRAVAELQALTNRQKGGWLLKTIKQRTTT